MQSSTDNPQITKETLNNLLLETTAALKNLNDNLTKAIQKYRPGELTIPLRKIQLL
jgi:hypothetical protein